MPTSGAGDYRDFLTLNVPDETYSYYYWSGSGAQVDEKPVYTTIKVIPNDDDRICPDLYGEFGSEFVAPNGDIRTKYLDDLSKYEFYKLETDNATGKEKEIHHKKMASYRQRVDEVAYEGFLSIMTKEVVDRDAKRLWMRSFKNQTGDYMLAEDFLKSNDYISMENTLTSMMQKYNFSPEELQDYDNMLNIFDELKKAADQDLAKEVIADLEEIANTEKGQSCFMARQILSRDYGYFYFPVISEGEIHRESSSASHVVAGPRMRVSPNPTDYYVRFDWSAFDTAGKEVMIEVTNQAGGLIDRLIPVRGTTTMDWTVERVKGSLCNYHLIVDRKEVDGGQIVITR